MPRMGFDPDVHHRRSIRLSGYNYSQPGANFLTLCMRDMKSLLGRIADGRMQLSPVGSIVQAYWLEIPRHFGHAELDEFVVMPNHLHAILTFDVGAHPVVPSVVGARHGVPHHPLPLPERFARPVSGSLASVLRLFKQAVTKRARDVGARHGVPLQIWQRNYYEHIIRNEVELGRIREYIATNVLRWACDRYNPDCGVLVRNEADELAPWGDQT